MPTRRPAHRTRRHRSRWCSATTSLAARGGARGGAEPCEPAVGATAEIVEVLRGARRVLRGRARRRRPNRLPEDIERALWDGVARGLLTPTGSARSAPRDRPAQARPPTSVASSRSRGCGARPVRGRRAGRWSLVPAADAAPDLDRDELAEAVAELLLQPLGRRVPRPRVHESMRFPWRDVQRALRRLEDRGLVRGGRFVTGFSGEQFALPAAAEQLTHVRKLAAHRRARHRERHRPAQPRRASSSRARRAGGPHPPGHLRRRRRRRVRRQGRTPSGRASGSQREDAG